MHKPAWLSRDLIGLSLTSLFSDFCYEMTTSLLPTFIEQLVGVKSAPLALGIITGFADASSMIMKLFSGWVADHITFFKPFVAAGYFVTAFFVSIIGTATHVWQVFLYQVCAWMGKGFREPIRDVWLTNITRASNYGKAFGFERAFDTIGAICGPLLAYFTINLVALRYNFFIAFIPGLLSVICMIFFTSNYKEPARKKETTPFFAHLKSLPTAFLYFVFVMFVFGIANFHKTLIIFRAQETLMGETGSTIIASSWAILLYVLFNAIRSLNEFFVGSLSDYVDRKFLMACGFGLFSVVTISMIFAGAHIPLWVFIFICAGSSAGIITAVEKSYAAQLLPQEVRGIGYGLLQSTDGLGDLLSSALVGLLWSTISAEFAFIYAFVLSIVALFLILLLEK